VLFGVANASENMMFPGGKLGASFVANVALLSPFRPIKGTMRPWFVVRAAGRRAKLKRLLATIAAQILPFENAIWTPFVPVAKRASAIKAAFATIAAVARQPMPN